MLEVRDITKKFGEIRALNGVSFDVNKGEVLGIIGPNGAGKTTLFSVISGFIKPDSGSIELNGRNIVGKKPNQLVKMGLVRTFQIIKVFKHMTVEENIMAANFNGKTSEILRSVGLWNKRNMLARNLSQGELRRLSIGMALATNPKILLLDEPFSGLSPKEAEDLDRIIRELNEYGITQIIIEHKLKELFNLAERVVVLNFGKVLFEGTPEEVVRNEEVIKAYLGCVKHA
jgi:branched-chain amino acid transport system ATP-binding protein